MTIPIFEYKKAAHQKNLQIPHWTKNYSEIAKLAVNYQLQNYLFLMSSADLSDTFHFWLDGLIMFLPTQFLHILCVQRNLPSCLMHAYMHGSLVASSERRQDHWNSKQVREENTTTQHSTDKYITRTLIILLLISLNLKLLLPSSI